MVYTMRTFMIEYVLRKREKDVTTSRQILPPAVHLGSLTVQEVGQRKRCVEVRHSRDRERPIEQPLTPGLPQHEVPPDQDADSR